MNRVVALDKKQNVSKRSLRLKKIVSKALKHMSQDQKEVHLNLIDDAQMKDLNRRFRGKNKTTDVLSFDVHESFEGFEFLGDILISPAQASTQAKARGHRVKDELAILAIHGLLHLLGYDHQTKAQETRMFSIQHDIFEKTKHYI